jgi:hypothetical protein
MLELPGLHSQAGAWEQVQLECNSFSYCLLKQLKQFYYSYMINLTTLAVNDLLLWH